jgi:ATP-binding cassette subfamily C protein
MSTAPALDCASLFEAEGTELIVGGNSPVLLSEPGTVYFVKKGRLEVFSVAVEDGAPVGARHHFFTAVEGDALFGMDLERYGEGQGFLAVGIVGTHLLTLHVDRLRAHLVHPEFAASLAPIVDRWVSGLSSGIARTISPHPRADLQIDAGEDGEVKDGQRVKARKAVAWVTHVEGASLFIGMEDLMELPPGALFPVTTSTWLQALGPLKVASVDAARAISSDAAWIGLDGFYGALFRCEFFNTRLAAADELNRLRDKAARDRRITSNSLSSLASVMSKKKSAFAEVPSDELLVAACMVVGKAMGIEIKAPPKPKDEESKTDRLDAIIRASRIRSRVVTLKGEWWTEEGGPMLAFIESEGPPQPVALLPRRRGYELHDPADHSQVRVTTAVADTLAGRAHTF